MIRGFGQKVMWQTTPQDLAEDFQKRRTAVPYFGLGFLKVRLATNIFQKISQQFAQHKHEFSLEKGNPYLHTSKPNYSPSLLSSDPEFNHTLLKELKPEHEKWSRLRLQEANCYGIRIYQPGSYLYNHVDRVKTHIISSTICVDYQLNTPWPLYIEDINGHPHEISMEPGEMVFFESAKLMHGRPYPLDGRFYAALFVHYTPYQMFSNNGEG